jgi:hypothetical protein
VYKIDNFVMNVPSTFYSYFYTALLPNGQPDLTKKYVMLGPGSYPNLQTVNTPAGVVNINDSIVAAQIHPTHQVTTCKDANYQNGCLVLHGNAGDDPNIPGYFTGANALSNGYTNVLSSIQITQQETPTQFVQDCCRQNNTAYSSEFLCGDYWSQNQAQCGNLGCTGGDLLTVPACQTWCNQNPTECNTVMTEFCPIGSTNPACACILDTQAAIAYREKYPTLATVPRQCWPDSPCQGTNLVNVLIPQGPDGLATTDCPTDLISQIENINVSNSVLVDSTVGGQTATSSVGTTTVKPGVTGNTTASSSSMLIYILLFIVAFLFIMAGGLLYMYPEWFSV